MVGTYQNLIEDLFFATFLGEAMWVSSCGEHVQAVLGHQGYKEEGKPFVIPFLQWINSGDEAALDSIKQFNGSKATCSEILDAYDGCAALVSPFSAETTQTYVAENGSELNCSAAPVVHVTGLGSVQQKAAGQTLPTFEFPPQGWLSRGQTMEVNKLVKEVNNLDMAGKMIVVALVVCLAAVCTVCLWPIGGHFTPRGQFTPRGRW